MSPTRTLALVGLAVAGCSTTTDLVASRYLQKVHVVAAQGATITENTVFSGLTVRIPAGALAADTDVTLEQGYDELATGNDSRLGAVLWLGPADASVGAPVVVTFPISGFSATDQASDVQVLSGELDGGLTRLPSAAVSVDFTAHTATYQLTRFGQTQPALHGCTVAGECAPGQCLDGRCRGPACGANTCALGQVCCSPSCGVCVAASGACPSTCSASTCDPTHCNVSGTSANGCCPLGQTCVGGTCAAPTVTCGTAVCKAGQTCCNASCNTCVDAGQTCSQVSCLCAVADCGPALATPVCACSDGSVGCNTGRCIRGAASTGAVCHWENRTCP